MNALRRRVVEFAAACALLTGAARAATFTVSTELDDVDASVGDGACATVDGGCSLRAAVQESNVLPGADIIILPAGNYELALAGTYEDGSATGDLDLLDAVTIRGASALTTIVDAMRLDRCLDVHEGPSSLSGVTLTGGGPEWPDMPDMQFCGGMLVRRFVSVVMQDCQVTDNWARDVGGGICADLGASLTLMRTTIYDNSVVNGRGGGVWAGESTLVLQDTTVNGNQASRGGGIAAEFATVSLRNCTVTANVGGEDGAGGIDGNQFELANTIVAGNTDDVEQDCGGTIVSLGYNVLGGGCLPTGDLTGNVVGAPLLGPLADNGGSVRTQALLPGSPAIDAGSPLAPGGGGAACDDEDARRFARPQDGNLDGTFICDIGAFELGIENYCANGLDDDGDMLIDCDDLDCLWLPPCDADGDGVANALDCAPNDAGANAPPTEVPRLAVTRRWDLGTDVAALAWTDLSALTGPVLLSDVFTGVITQMRSDRGLAGASCLAGDVRALTAVDPRMLPVSSDGFWYLVRAQSACDTGTLGEDSDGIPRDLGGVSCP